MNTIVALSNSQVQTMSSREIADLVESRHSDIVRSIQRLMANTVISGYAPTAYTHPQNGQTYECYYLNKRDSLVVVAQNCPQFTARIVDRWQELEAQQQKNSIVMPNFTDPAEAAIAWATEYKAKQLALQQLEVAKPKVEFVNKFVERGTNRNVTSVAKELGVTAIKLGKWLRAKGYMNKATDKQVWNKEFIDKGYGVQKLFNVEVQDEEFKSGSQALITPAGDVFIKEQVKQYGFTVEVK